MGVCLREGIIAFKCLMRRGDIMQKSPKIVLVREKKKRYYIRGCLCRAFTLSLGLFFSCLVLGGFLSAVLKLTTGGHYGSLLNWSTALSLTELLPHWAILWKLLSGRDVQGHSLSGHFCCCKAVSLAPSCLCFQSRRLFSSPSFRPHLKYILRVSVFSSVFSPSVCPQLCVFLNV